MELPALPPMDKPDSKAWLGSEDLKHNPPDFIRTELQLHYYHTTYDQIKDNGTVMQNVDAVGLGMLALNLALVDKCMSDIDDIGISAKVQGDRNVVTKRNPAIDMLDKAQSAIRFYLKEFKMTPNSRGKVLGSGAAINPQSDGFEQV